MPMCKFCGVPFAWGNADGKWIALIPIGEEGNHDRAYQDENGILRAGHKLVCTQVGGHSVRIAVLAKAIPAKDVLPGVVIDSPTAVPKKKRGPKPKEKIYKEKS